MTSDSQPVDIYPQRVEMPANRALFENHLLPASLRGFNGVAGYVGTIGIEDGSTRNWLDRALAAHAALSLDQTCHGMAEELTAIWSEEHLDTHLSIFVAGYEDGEARYWYVSNGGFPTGDVEFPRTFDAIDDLDCVWVQRNAQPGESKDQLVARTYPSFRRGVLSAASIFDSFTAVVRETLRAGHPQFQPLDSLDRFAAYTRFRFEFTKRMYDPKYGMGIDPHPPVRGDIRVISVAPTGVCREHAKHVTQVNSLA